MFHLNDAGIAFGMDMLQDASIVQFSSCRLRASRSICDLEVADLVPGVVYVINDVSSFELLLKNIKEQLASRAVNSLSNQVAVRNFGEERPRSPLASDWLDALGNPFRLA